MTIVVTGGAGFIGSNFVFYRKGHDLRFLCVDEKEVCERVNESACNRSHRTIGI